MTRGVFFDLGGTLFSYRNVPRATVPLLLEVVKRNQLNADLVGIKTAYTQAGQEVAAAYADRSYYAHRDFFLDTLRSFTALLDGQCDAETEQWYLEAHRSAIIDCLELKPDCIETLQYLRGSGLYLSVVSNIDDDMLLPLIERENLQQYFAHCTSSEAALSCKPHRGFFEHALELSGLEAADVLFVGDSPEHDIAGASAMGMRTALVNDGGMPPPLQTGRKNIEADHIIGSLTELKALFAA